jgi:hypothetical protein
MLKGWAQERLIPAPPVGAGPAMIGLLIGLEMQHRLDPAAITAEIALASLRALLGVGERLISH